MITYRKAEFSDIAELLKLRIEFLSIVNAGIDCPENFEKILHAYYNESIKNGSFVTWLACDGEGERIVGSSGICFYLVPPSYKNLRGKNAYIMNVYTKEPYRGQGIATHLLDLAVKEAGQRGYNKIYLHATAEGQPIYKKYGFKDTGDEMVYDI